MNWLIFIASTLACFRLTRLISDDKIFDWLRRLVVRESPRKLKEKAKQGITCPFCVSFYFSTLIATGLWYAGFFPAMWILFWQPAIWGGSVIFNQIFVSLSDPLFTS